LMRDIDSMHEENPMLGLRGCRLGIVHNEMSVMQVEAIMGAACDLVEESKDARPFPRIMIPLIGSVREFEQQAVLIKRTAERVQQDRGIKVRYEIGTMIEVPRAALVADKIAAVADPDADGDESGNAPKLCSFFSFGTNDLTQMTMGISRDDAGGFISKYRELRIFDEDPFKSIDVEGVGWLVQLAAAKGRSVNPLLSLSVCGEHGGDPSSIGFFDEVGLDYVSCSPFRVPVARLACGRAAIRREGGRPQYAPKKDRVLQHMPIG
jgi:pyruvate, orthophosphate dikinase